MKKVLAIDAVGCLVNFKGKVNNDIKNLVKKFKNKKIVLTNADELEKKIFLKNITYETFSLKHKPNKSNPKYFKKFLLKYKLEPQQLIYIEHDIKAVKSAQSLGIVTHHFNGNLKNLENFLNLFLNKNQSYPKKK